MKSTFGSAVRTARFRMKLSQKDVADAMGYSTPQFISNWERGISVVSKKHIQKLSVLLNIPLTKMIDLIVSHHADRTAVKIRKSMGLC